MSWFFNFTFAFSFFATYFVLSLVLKKRFKKVPVKKAAYAEFILWGLGYMLSKQYLNALASLFWAIVGVLFFKYLAAGKEGIEIGLYVLYFIITLFHFSSVRDSNKPKGSGGSGGFDERDFMEKMHTPSGDY